MHPTVALSRPPTRAASPTRRTARRATTAAIFACIVLLGIFLLRGHSTGGELPGPVAAIAGIAAGGLGLAAGGAAGRRSLRLTAVTLWAVVVLLGVAGTIDHTKPVRPEHGDRRPRPAYVPLVVALVGGAGVAAAVRPSGRREVRVGWPGEEVRT